jgi:S1-C subfamily serine protease
MGPEMHTEESLAAPPIENVQAPITQLERQDVVETVDAGLGAFLQDFSTEPSLTPEGEFVGFKIVRIHDRKKYEGLGIGPGDVVTSINGRPIERPTQAYAAFVSLKTAQSLDIEYLRGGRVMRLSLPIVGEAKPEGAKDAEKKQAAGSEGSSGPSAAGAEKKNATSEQSGGEKKK